MLGAMVLISVECLWQEAETERQKERQGESSGKKKNPKGE
jgi:hypothetical protein